MHVHVHVRPYVEKTQQSVSLYFPLQCNNDGMHINKSIALLQHNYTTQNTTQHNITELYRNVTSIQLTDKNNAKT